jgi:hypothetical protein
MIRRGVGRTARPGLLNTMARTAVIAGTATAVSGKVAQKQAASAQQAADAQAYREMQATAPPPEPPPAAATPAPAPAAPPAMDHDELIAKLTQLAQLRDQGILTEDEFAAQKAKLLG